MAALVASQSVHLYIFVVLWHHKIFTALRPGSTKIILPGFALNNRVQVCDHRLWLGKPRRMPDSSNAAEVKNN